TRADAPGARSPPGRGGTPPAESSSATPAVPGQCRGGRRGGAGPRDGRKRRGGHRDRESVQAAWQRGEGQREKGKRRPKTKDQTTLTADRTPAYGPRRPGPTPATSACAP